MSSVAALTASGRFKLHFVTDTGHKSPIWAGVIDTIPNLATLTARARAIHLSERHVHHQQLLEKVRVCSGVSDGCNHDGPCWSTGIGQLLQCHLSVALRILSRCCGCCLAGHSDVGNPEDTWMRSATRIACTAVSPRKL